MKNNNPIHVNDFATVLKLWPTHSAASIANQLNQQAAYLNRIKEHHVYTVLRALRKQLEFEIEHAQVQGNQDAYQQLQAKLNTYFASKRDRRASHLRQAIDTPLPQE